MDIGMSFNEIDLKPYFLIQAVRGRGIISQEIESVDIPARHGSYYRRRKKPPRILEIDIVIDAESPQDLRSKIDDLNEILAVDEPVQINFEDESEWTYYGIPEQSTEDEEIVSHSRQTLVIKCDDPYKYGDEKIATLNTNEGTIIEYEGSVPSPPTFELDVLSPTTYVMIGNEDEEYNMIGTPSDEEEEVVSQKDVILSEEGEGIDQWDTSPTENDPVSGYITDDGQMVYDGSGIVVSDYGTPSDNENGYGPAIIRDLGVQIQDFEIDVNIDTRTDYREENFRVEIHLFDEGLNMLGKIGIRDRFRDFHNRSAMARVGEYVDGNTRYVIGSGNYDHNDFGKSSLFNMKWRRKGDIHEFYVAQVVNGRHQDSLVASYTDRSGNWNGRLQYVQIYIRTWKGRREPYLARINNLTVYELNEITEDQTPYIVGEGDKVVFNHENKEITINGENAEEEKAFIGKYFKFKKGENNVAIMPGNIQGLVRWRDIRE